MTDASANRVCAQLLLLSAEDPRADIGLYINSPGGSVSAGLAIYDTMKMIPNDVGTLAMGFAASMGQFLLCAGTPGKRAALPNARIMMHQGSAGIGGTAVDIEIQAQNLSHMKKLMTSLLAENTGQSRGEIARDSRPRPLVHRDRGPRLRHGRPGGAAPRRRPAARRLPQSGAVTMASYTIPTVVERTPTGERAFDIYCRLLSERIIFVGTEIDDGVANVVMAQMLHLEALSTDQDIEIYINSPGGSYTALMAIYDTMQFIHADVATTCMGQAASAAAILLAAGAAGKRCGAVALPGAAAPAVHRRAGHAVRPRAAGPTRCSGSAPRPRSC